MKIISIGDLHGKQDWKQIDPAKYDKIIFVGDYVDQWPPVTDEAILVNLLDLIEFKKANPMKVILLLGNHDIQYFFLGEFGCSGFRPSMAAALQHVFNTNKELFQVAYQLDTTTGRYLWSHAGVSAGWYKFNIESIEDVAQRFETESLADTLNHMLALGKENANLHQVSRKRGGYYEWGGVTWADRDETRNNYLDGYHQIVGHTPIGAITKFGDDKGSIRYIDVLDEYNYQNGKIVRAVEKNDYNDKIKRLFPGIELDKEKHKPLIAQFYEFEIEHSL